MKLLLVLGVLTITLIYLRKQNVEPVVLSCCGNVRWILTLKKQTLILKKNRKVFKIMGRPCTNIGVDCCEGTDTCK